MIETRGDVAGAPPPGNARNDTKVARAVAEMWVNLLGRQAYAGDQPWHLAGGDKLKMLRLAHGIERRLGRRIPLDAMSREMRPSELIERLTVATGDARNASGSAERIGDSPATRTVVVMPGLRGDDPNLVAFRKMLGPEYRCTLARYPSWERLAGPDASLSIAVDHVIAQIRRDVHTRPLILIGYSVGGVVAHEVGRRLAAEGDDVCFVGMIDSFVSSAVVPDIVFDRPAEKQRKTLSMRIGFHVARFVHGRPALEARIARLQGLVRPPRDIAFFFRHYMTLWVQIAVADRWQPKLLSVPATLFRASIRAGEIPRDLGWQPFTSDLTVVDVEGNHLSMIGGAHCRQLADKVRATIEART